MSIKGVLRTCLLLAACGAVLPVEGKPVRGLPVDYPAKPVRVIVGAPSGGGTDIVARLVMRSLGRLWQHKFVVENRVSLMGSVMALDYVSKQPADGYTLSVASGSAYLNAALISGMPKNVMRALDPVAQFTASPFVLVVSKSLPVRNLNDFVAYVRRNPGRLDYASTGIGGSAHLATEYMKEGLELSIGHAPYKGMGPGYVDLLAGKVHMAFGTTTSALPYVRKGALKLMAVTSARRLDEFPDAPALAEVIPGFEYVSFFGVVAPAGTPKPVIDALNEGINKVLVMPEVKKRLSLGGAIVKPSTPEEFRKAVESFIGHAQKLVKAARLDLHTAR